MLREKQERPTDKDFSRPNFASAPVLFEVVSSAKDNIYDVTDAKK